MMAENQDGQDRGLFGMKKGEHGGRQDHEMMQAQAVRTNPAQKPGLMDKIKQKLPGGQTRTGQFKTTKKVGMVDKVKEKLPGGQTQTGQFKTTKKVGMVDKVKDKLPGGHTQTKKVGLVDKVKEKLPGGQRK